MVDETFEKHVPEKFRVPLTKELTSKLIQDFNKSGGVPFTVGATLKRLSSKSLTSYEPFKGTSDGFTYNYDVRVLDLEQNKSRYVFVFMNLSPVSKGLSIWKWENNTVKLLLVLECAAEGMMITGDSDLVITAADPITLSILRFSRKEKKFIPVVMYDAYRILYSTPTEAKNNAEPMPCRLASTIPDMRLGADANDPSANPFKAGTTGWLIGQAGDRALIIVPSAKPPDNNMFARDFAGRWYTGGWIKSADCKDQKPGT